MSSEFDRREENRLRAAVTRAGYMLRKSRSRNPNIPGFGMFCIVDPTTNTLAAGGDCLSSYSMSLDEVQDWVV